MKILQLNVWTGRLKGALERFVRENDADILCMQEAVWSEDNPDVVITIGGDGTFLRAVHKYMNQMFRYLS